MTSRNSSSLNLQVWCALLLQLTHFSLSMRLPNNRRHFLSSSCAAASCLYYPRAVFADNNLSDEQIVESLLDAKTVFWNSSSYAKSRYRSSTLQTSKTSQSAPTPGPPSFYPKWLEGYYTINYKFTGAFFPQGRKTVSIRTAGAGLGSCLSLPNVGYNPSAHGIHFIRDSSNGEVVYEDLAYNIPRKFESFWPQAKVLAIQTNGEIDQSNKLSPKCLVTGDGCSSGVNPNLHSPATRVVMDFDGPARQGGRLTQSCDVTMLGCCIQSNERDACYYTAKSFSQYNIHQDLQTFYREIISFQRITGGIVIKLRVAAFLPRYIKEMDARGPGDDYDENEAIAIYDYKAFMQAIDEDNAARLWKYCKINNAKH